MKSPSKTWACLGNRKIVSWKRKLLSLPCAAGLRQCNMFHRDLLSFLCPWTCTSPPSWTQQLAISSFPQQKCQRSSDAGPRGALSPAASAASPGGRGKPCCLEKTHPDPHPGKFSLWAGEAAGLCSTLSSLHLAPPPATAPVTRDPSKPSGAAEYSLWQRQIGLFWPNFLPVPQEKRGSRALTKELEAPGRERSSECKHLACHSTEELCQRTSCISLGTAPAEDLEQQGRGEGAFICPGKSLKNQEVLKAAAFPAMHDTCAVSADGSPKNIIP